MARLRKLVVAGVRRFTGWRTGNAPREGVPEGITFETLNDVCLRHRGAPLKRVAYIHLSFWKSAGSYRLLLSTAKRQHWSLIYKNAIYHLADIPALAQLPVMPGPPEYLVYSNPQGTLATYLPAVYLCREIIPGKHYQYLLEDLSAGYQPTTRKTAPQVATELPAIHRAMQEWSHNIDQSRLLHYGHAFSIALQHYVRENLQRYHDHTADETVATALRLWPEIAALHGHEEFYTRQTLRPIHGDFNIKNILLHKEHHNRFKLIDWEWAGFGRLHAELASLLKNVPPEIEQEVLARLSAQENHVSPDEHRRLYYWCRLERGLLDAAFLARQQLELPNSTPNLHQHIVAATQRALHAYQELGS